MLEVVEARKIDAGLARNERWIFAFDNARVHSNAGNVMDNRVGKWPQPAHSPDMQKVIEHVHGQLDQHMQAWLKQQRAHNPRARVELDACKQELVSAFNNLSTAAIKRDVDSLPDTWQAIKAAGGCYVAPELS